MTRRTLILALLSVSCFLDAGRPLRAEPAAPTASGLEGRPYALVDTAQVRCYDDLREIAYPGQGQPFFGQDAQYAGTEPSYRDNGDGTVTDLVTGLTWQQDPGEKTTWAEAVVGASRCRLGGHADWRMPTLKELYSLIRFDGTDPDPRAGDTANQRPFLDEVFAFRYGDPSKGERVIDAQFASATRYVSTTMHGAATVFGVNFADGRIKGYGLQDPRGRGEKTFFVLYVRGNPRYGHNDFVDQGDGTVLDRATGLVWTKQDSGHLGAGPRGDGRLSWKEALAWAEGLALAGHDDWRLPDAKELQSLVDYGRSPDTTRSAAIDPLFEVSTIRDEQGRADFPYFWTSTSHASLRGAEAAVYVAFGRAPGWMPDRRTGAHAFLDVHGAGAQRSDPKDGDASAFPHGRGPQGDVLRILNHVRCVRGGGVRPRTEGPPLAPVARGPTGGPGGAGGPPPGGFVARLDRDRDGKVSREEFDGPPEHFESLDKNGDGYLVEDEAPPVPPPGGLPGGRRGRGGRGGGQGPPR